MDLLDFKTWTGTRSDLLAILQDFEMENPTQYGLVSKTGGKLLPVKQRRIQQFIDMGILPKPKSLKAVSTDNTHAYDFEHLARYIAAISLRKSKYTLEQAADSLMKMDISDVVEVVLKRGKNTLGLGSDKKTALLAPSSGFDSQALRRLGRTEGRAIKSEQILLAITPWCHVFVSKRQLAKLDLQDIAVLTSAFEDGLRSAVEK